MTDEKIRLRQKNALHAMSARHYILIFRPIFS